MGAISCVIDWPGTMSFLKDLIVSIAAIVTATVAYLGVHKWRKEEAGKADFELARRIGTVLFRLRDSLAAARSPMIWANEFPEDYDPTNLSKQAAAFAHVFDRRFEAVRKSAIELQSLANEAEALWGGEMMASIIQVLKLTTNLHTSMQMYVRDKYQFGSMFRRDEAFARHIESVVQDIPIINPDGTSGKNKFSEQIDEAISEFAAQLREKLPSTQRREQSKPFADWRRQKRLL